MKARVGSAIRILSEHVNLTRSALDMRESENSNEDVGNVNVGELVVYNK